MCHETSFSAIKKWGFGLQNFIAWRMAGHYYAWGEQCAVASLIRLCSSCLMHFLTFALHILFHPLAGEWGVSEGLCGCLVVWQGQSTAGSWAGPCPARPGELPWHWFCVTCPSSVAGNIKLHGALPLFLEIFDATALTIALTEVWFFTVLSRKKPKKYCSVTKIQMFQLKIQINLLR